MDEQQLKQVEALCETLYTGAPHTSSSDSTLITRAEAQSRLLSLQSSADYIPQCQYILDRSSSQYARLVAANSLTELVSSHWNNYTIAQRIDIRNYVLGYLANHGPSLQDFVTTALIQLVCRITKLGWFDDVTHRELTDDITKFLQATVDHCILGLKLLNQLVEELNLPTVGRTLTQHRKTSVSFRDSSLFQVFKLGLTTLQQLQSRAIVAEPRQEQIMGELALALTEKCLNFDFIGTNPDDSAEDVGTIQVPSSWRPVITDPSTMDLLFEFYKTTEPPRSSKAMEAIVLMCSVRRSIFATEQDRAEFLSRVMTGIRTLLQQQTGFQHSDNYHQFCRLLGRIKANYQLSELVKADGYIEWLELASNFTVQSVTNWQYCTNSIHYLMALWGRLVAAVPYVRADTGVSGHAEALEQQVLTVMDAYISSMVGSVELVVNSDGTLDDPLDDDGSLKEQLDRLPVLCRFKYAQVANSILNKFDPLLNQYRQALNHIGTSTSTDNAPPDIARSIEIMEGQLTWLTYFVGTIVGGHSWSSSHLGDGDETIDASLSRRALQLAQCLDFRLTSSNGVGRSNPKLEQALLYYFQNFRRVYMFMWDQVANPESASNAVSVVGMLASKLEAGPSTKQQVYQRMFEHLGMGDHSTVANLIVTKIGNNLKYWPDDNDIIQKTLDLLSDMAAGYSSSKLLLTLDTVKFLAHHHTETHFPFLAVPANVRYRTTFHSILCRLLLSPTGEDKLEITFEQFVEPILNNLTQLENLSLAELRSEAAKRLLIGAFRDLRGIAVSLHNRKAYAQFFELMHPVHLPLLSKVADVWNDQIDVIVSLLRFLQEFCHNKANRVNFDPSSPNGILLFKATSDVVCSYGRRLLESPIPDDNLYKRRYKGMSLALSVLNSALSGNYVCFGIFSLYNDPCLDNALDVALKMVLSAPVDDVISYPKLSKSYFGFIEIFFRNHIKTVLALETNVLMQLMNAVHEGLQASDPQLSSLCANAVDHLATFYFENMGKEKVLEVQYLNKHLAAQPNLFSSFTSTLFNLLLFGAPQNHWAVIKPMLSLMLASESSFTAYKDHLISTQSPDNQNALNEAFSKLLQDVQRSLDSANRDRFTQKLVAFRVTVRGFLTL